MNNAERIAAMFRSDFGLTKLSEKGERRYCELAFLAGYCHGHLPSQELTDEILDLEASANPVQTSLKIDFAKLGRAYRDQ